MDKVAREVAEADFERFCEMLAAFSDAAELKDEEDKKSFLENKNRFVAAVMSGSLVVADDGSATYTPSNGSSDLTFREPNAGQLLAVDRHKQGHGIAKQIALIASLSGKTEAEIGKLPMRDIRVLNAVTAGFF